MIDAARIDGDIALIQSRRFLQAHRAQVQDPDFWRSLNPQLTISSHPLACIYVVPAACPLAVGFDDRVTFETRLAWIADSLSMPDLVDGLRV